MRCTSGKARRSYASRQVGVWSHTESGAVNDTLTAMLAHDITQISAKHTGLNVTQQRSAKPAITQRVHVLKKKGEGVLAASC